MSSRLVFDTISKPNRHCSRASSKVQVSGSQRTRNSSTHVFRRPCLIRLGSERAKIWYMTPVSPGASLLLRGSIVVWIFILWPCRLCEMCSVIFADLAGFPWGWDRDARSNALWMESCLEAASTTKGISLSGMIPQSTFNMDLHRGAVELSQPNVLVTLHMKVC